jgi:hypothetical protein
MPARPLVPALALLLPALPALPVRPPAPALPALLVSEGDEPLELHAGWLISKPKAKRVDARVFMRVSMSGGAPGARSQKTRVATLHGSVWDTARKHRHQRIGCELETNPSGALEETKSPVSRSSRWRS